jgi:DNA-binding NtrC family response regulator
MGGWLKGRIEQEQTMNENNTNSNPVTNYDRESYILVVDDDQTLLKFFKIHLNKFFSRVIVVKNVKEAIATLQEKQIDLVISDIRMPKTTGLQLIRKVRNHDPSIPIFLISGALLSDEQMMEVDTYADAFLKKPFSVDELHAFIVKGLSYRETYKKMEKIIDNKKFFTDFVKRKNKLEEIKDEAKRTQVVELYTQLKAS